MPPPRILGLPIEIIMKVFHLVLQDGGTIEDIENCIIAVPGLAFAITIITDNSIPVPTLFFHRSDYSWRKKLPCVTLDEFRKTMRDSRFDISRAGLAYKFILLELNNVDNAVDDDIWTFVTEMPSYFSKRLSARPIVKIFTMSTDSIGSKLVKDLVKKGVFLCHSVYCDPTESLVCYILFGSSSAPRWIVANAAVFVLRFCLLTCFFVGFGSSTQVISSKFRAMRLKTSTKLDVQYTEVARESRIPGWLSHETSPQCDSYLFTLEILPTILKKNSLDVTLVDLNFHKLPPVFTQSLGYGELFGSTETEGTNFKSFQLINTAYQGRSRCSAHPAPTDDEGKYNYYEGNAKSYRFVRGCSSVCLFGYSERALTEMIGGLSQEQCQIKRLSWRCSTAPGTDEQPRVLLRSAQVIIPKLESLILWSERSPTFVLDNSPLLKEMTLVSIGQSNGSWNIARLLTQVSETLKKVTFIVHPTSTSRRHEIHIDANDLSALAGVEHLVVYGLLLHKHLLTHAHFVLARVKELKLDVSSVEVIPVGRDSPRSNDQPSTTHKIVLDTRRLFPNVLSLCLYGAIPEEGLTLMPYPPQAKSTILIVSATSKLKRVAISTSVSTNVSVNGTTLENSIDLKEKNAAKKYLVQIWESCNDAVDFESSAATTARDPMVDFHEWLYEQTTKKF